LKPLKKSANIALESKYSPIGEAPIQIKAAARKHREMPMGKQVLPYQGST
jgi:hypothetical protein